MSKKKGKQALAPMMILALLAFLFIFAQTIKGGDAGERQKAAARRRTAAARAFLGIVFAVAALVAATTKAAGGSMETAQVALWVAAVASGIGAIWSLARR